jgi:glycosyltransferase involved in cell wall biosynthesis
LYKGVIFQASTEAEVADIQNALGKGTAIQLAGNLPKKKNYQAIGMKEKTVGMLRLVNIARIAPEKNLKFALEILMEVKAKIQFDFYGPVYNKSYFEECKEVIQKLGSNIQVNYKNSIESSEVESTFEGYHCLFMPSLGENFGHIILESFLAGCPVIISDQTPWRSLNTRKLGFDISLAEKANFVAAIEQLARIPQNEFNEWSNAAYKFGYAYVNNPEILKQNLNLFST